MRCRVTHHPGEAAEALRQGLLVALPTETVYGLGANALDAQAVAGIFAAKDRPAFDPLIVHVACVDEAPRVAAEFPLLARQLAARFWPGPLTLVLPKMPAVPDLVTSGLPSVGVRIPDHPLTQRVLEIAGFPIAAPSANLFGRLSPTTVSHVLEQLGDRIDLVLDGGPCRVGVESTILQLHAGHAVLLRPGGVAVEDIEQMTGPVEVPAIGANQVPIAPGQLPSHYAPRTPLRIVDRVPDIAPGTAVGVLQASPERLTGYAAVEVLSTTGDLAEAAANFFPALHRLDAMNLELILACRFPGHGLGRALNDRLQKASGSLTS